MGGATKQGPKWVAQAEPVAQKTEEGAASATPPASDAVRREWRRRIEAEYQSAARTQHLTLWLVQLGAPRELIDDGLRIVTDELDHAELSAQVAAQAGNEEPPVIRHEALTLNAPAGSLEEQTLFATLEVFCLGETVAVPLFTELRRECTVPVARQALDRILRDEVRHKQFGWDLLDYLCERSPGLVEHARQILPELLSRIQRRYTAAPGTRVSGDERAWGLMPSDEYGAIVQATIEKEYTPRFKERGMLP
ncbi:MAG TPA: ferritin-like domain-containing protein [Polyangiaceae bacterium]|nr:ferritin-like domain-containing protein [Polyangiaceae bacterium]